MKYITFFAVALFLFSCQTEPTENIVKVSTMGTIGMIKYITDKPIDFQKEIDSILLDVNLSLSTYIDSSTISRHNFNPTDISITDFHFNENLKASIDIYNHTNTAFNPAIMPLVNYWKVQNKSESTYAMLPDSLYIDSIVIYINNNDLKNIALDFSALAKGYGVDVVAQFIESKGITNYMVEIGGEVNCKGKNIKNEFWKIGIEEPNEETQTIHQVVHVKNKSMATSGNYRNYKVLDSGQKLVHIINPKTGYPEISNLLSATIIADNCMYADAYATACMVMGVDTCFNLMMNTPHLECYLLYSDETGTIQKKYTPGFEQYLTAE